MKDFIFYMPARVLFGAGQLNHLHEQKLPGKKALIVTSNGQSTKNTAILHAPRRSWNLPVWNMCCLTRFAPIRPVRM